MTAANLAPSKFFAVKQKRGNDDESNASSRPTLFDLGEDADEDEGSS
jgi:hypothetical protein